MEIFVVIVEENVNIIIGVTYIDSLLMNKKLSEYNKKELLDTLTKMINVDIRKRSTFDNILRIITRRARIRSLNNSLIEIKTKSSNNILNKSLKIKKVFDDIQKK